MTRRVPLLLLSLAACDLDFERMIDQPKVDVYEPTRHFADGTSMRRAPAGTVHRGAEIRPRPVEEGLTAAGDLAAEIPIEISSRDLLAGHRSYMIFCKPCHGAIGNGDTPVARDMRLRRPPSLVDDPIRSYPPGRVFRAVTIGYGLMPSYSQQLSVDERWQVVAYVQALQLSQRVRLPELPPELRERARQQLPGGARARSATPTQSLAGGKR